MKKQLSIFAIGIIAGAASWAVVGLVSDRFEPFDSTAGFYTGQFILSVIAFWTGYKKQITYLLIYLIAVHIGMNTYAYIFGGLEHRAWARLGLITTLMLLIYPLIFGVIGKLSAMGMIKLNNKN